MSITANKIAAYRREVANIQKATAAGTRNFELHAELHKSKVFRCNYRDLQFLYCDTMAVVDTPTHGRCMVITEQNLQYFPSKVRYFIPISSQQSVSNQTQLQTA